MTGFEISISGRDDGTIEAVYISVGDNKVFRTKEIVPNQLLVDYDRGGNIVGIEILAPVRIADITRLVDQSSRKPFKRFVTESVPDQFVCN